MDKLRVWIGASLAWLLLFFNIERFHEPINIASFVYVLAAGIAILIVVARPCQNLALATLLVGSLSLFLILKVLLPYPVFGPGLPITVTEACAVTITVLLARGIACRIEQFEEGATHVMTMQFGGAQTSFDTGQADLYREIRRARDFERPLAMLALSATGESTSATLNRFIQEVQRSAIKKYVDAQVGQMLTKEMKDCDIVAHCDDHFVILLPEATAREVEEVIARLRRRIEEELGLQLEMGTATFPDQEVTLTGLLQRAQKDMRAANGAAKQAEIITG